MTINTVLAPEFEIACDLLYLRPEEVIQAFIQNVSLPYFCSTDEYLETNFYKPNLPLLNNSFNSNTGEMNSSANPVKILATNFLLTYCALFNERVLPAQAIQEKYFKRFKEIAPSLKEQVSDRRYKRLFWLYFDWHEELIKNMSEGDAIVDVKERKKKINFNDEKNKTQS